jgi:hypothetical protein
MSIEDYHQVFPEIILEEEESSNGKGKFWGLMGSSLAENYLPRSLLKCSNHL